ncbi:MAG TPA: D-alanyl-D-alanine carboxypeptidase family protein [Polyangiaceae bacterium]|nr:D-alanyl-D-alanine carboxypeptidase family protein [Polyangiaceae bacterium]
MVWRTLALDFRLTKRSPGRLPARPRPLVLASGFVLGALVESALAGAPSLRGSSALADPAPPALTPAGARSGAPKGSAKAGDGARGAAAGASARAPERGPHARAPAAEGAPARPAEGGAHARPTEGGAHARPAEGRARGGPPAPAKPLDACDPRAIALEAACDPPLTSDGTCPPTDPTDLLYYVNRWFPISPRYPISDTSFWTPCSGPLYGFRYDLVCLPPAYSYGSNSLRKVAFESAAPPAPTHTFDGRTVGFRGKVGFRALLDAARDEGGYSVYVRSGFRPYATQAAVFRRWVAEEETHHGLSHPEALARASLSSAREGHSEHQLGTTADLVYRTEKGPIYEGWAPEIIAESAPMRWVHENAHRFGIVLTYERDKEKITQYQWEPWHYRYVGVAAADTMRRCHLSTEEYLNARYGIGPLPRHPDAARLFEGAPDPKGG